MLAYLDERNENPKPFMWTADADLIRRKVAQFSKSYFPLRALAKDCDVFGQLSSPRSH